MRDAERWVACVRLAGAVFAVLEIGIFTKAFPGGYEQAAWVVTVALIVGALVFWRLSLLDSLPIAQVALAALVFDTLILCAYATIFAFEYGSPTRWLLVLVVVEAALRFGIWGGVGLPVLLIPFFAFVEIWRADHFGPPAFLADRVSFPAGMMILAGGFVGWLVDRLDREAERAESRAAEAESLRDELGRRFDVLEAANRCARALGSSLDLEQAFGAFIRELRGLIGFDRIAIVLVEGDSASVIATAGRGVDDVYPPGSAEPYHGTILERVLEGHTELRQDMSEPAYPEERILTGLGLRSRLVAPLLVGARPIGMLSLSREQANAFTSAEVELVSLLGRLVGTAVQNIRAYEAEHRTAEELRRLSALRADFVSLVSHELRSPMAAVIGAARTLQERWRLLKHEQRDGLLALIAGETHRLTNLIGDVLDTSRIEAGTFSCAFDVVDVTDVLGAAVAAAGLAQDEVRVTSTVNGTLPLVRGDRERLRQVVSNLIDNAVKYSPAGECVEVQASPAGQGVKIEVHDHGPGIASEHQRVIFEKFGRVKVGGEQKPGTGLGLFIARSIAEAHGGSLEVRSAAGQGSTFVLVLPVDRAQAN
jgi:signal transduction histidine kinase